MVIFYEILSEMYLSNWLIIKWPFIKKFASICKFKIFSFYFKSILQFCEIYWKIHDALIERFLVERICPELNTKSSSATSINLGALLIWLIFLFSRNRRFLPEGAFLNFPKTREFSQFLLDNMLRMGIVCWTNCIAKIL